MFDQALAGLTLATLVLGLWMLRYGDNSPAGWFLLSWLLSSFAVVLNGFEDRYPILAATYFAHGTVSVALLYGGVRVLVQRAIPGWFLPTALAFGLARSAIGGLGAPDFALGLGLPVLLFAGAAGVLALRERPKTGRTVAIRVLGSVLLLVFGVACASVITRIALPNPPQELLLMWPFLATILLAVELYAVAEHRGNQLRERRDELERLVDERAGVISRINVSLAESEQRYRAVSELSSDFSFCLRVGPDGVVEREWVTEAFERITGHPPEVLDGDGWATLLHGDIGPASAEDHEQLLALTDEATIQYPVVRPDGTTRRLDVVLRADRTSEDGSLRVLGAARDVTEALESEEARRDLERQIEAAQRMESLGMLAGGIAHDFNNLLAVILGNTRLVRDELPLDSALAGKLGSIQSAAEHAARLTEQMLTYSGKAIVSLTPIELSGLVRDVRDLLQDSVGSRCRLEFELDDNARVAGDATRLSQVILNLVTNAREALDHGQGRVTLRTGRSYIDATTLASAAGADDLQPGDYIWLEVSDDGTGMSAETRRRIFEPFFTTKFSGRGLGLASVLGIVRAHGGRVELTSEIDRGTRVRVLLPPSDAPLPQRHPEAAVTLEPERVLVVDDDEAVLELASEFLRRAGYDSHQAAGGVEAVELFEKKKSEIDVVVLDLTMPDMDGRQCFAELRRIRGDVPVVLATGYSQGTLEESFPDERHISFLRKPYEPEQLLDAIQKARSEADG